MGELINGRTPEQIRFNISECSRSNCLSECPYENQPIESCAEGLLSDALALIERLEAERDAALAKVPKWISVKDRMPPPETERYWTVSVCKDGYRITNTTVWAWDENDEKGEWIKWDPVTHWMPLPEPPEEDAHG